MKLRNGKKADASPERGLVGMLERLEAARRTLAEAAEAEKQAEQAKAEADQLIDDEFMGHVPPDESLRRRAEAEQQLVAAQRAREHSEKLVAAGEREALRLVDEVAGQREAQRVAKIDAAQRDFADAQARVLNAQARLELLDAERVDAERQHSDARALVQGRERRDWHGEDMRRVRAFVEGVRREQAGVTPLPAHLQPLADQYVRDLEHKGVSPAYLRHVAEQYVLLPESGAARLPDHFQARP